MEYTSKVLFDSHYVIYEFILSIFAYALIKGFKSINNKLDQILLNVNYKKKIGIQ